MFGIDSGTTRDSEMESMDKAGDKEGRDSSESPFEGTDNQSFPSKQEEKVRLVNKIDRPF
jgi:hypothetical protein